MTRSGNTLPTVVFLSPDVRDGQAFVRELAITEYHAVVCLDETELDACIRGGDCIAVVLDADHMNLSNAWIRRMKQVYPDVPFLIASRSPFHPELQEAIRHLLYACVKKPADIDELTYLLNAMRTP